jgi:hypothetical protein
VDGELPGIHVGEHALALGVAGGLGQGVPVADQGDKQFGHRLLACVLDAVPIRVVEDCVCTHVNGGRCMPASIPAWASP